MSKKYIEIQDLKFLRGPNMWTYRPVLEALVDIGDLEDFPSNKIPGLPERLEAWLPGLIEHRCSVGERGGFLKRLREGTWPAHILEHVTLELKTMAGLPSGFGKARETSKRGVYKVIVRARDEKITLEALHSARDLLMAAIEDRSYDVAGAVEKLSDMSNRLSLGPSTACIVDAADDRDIPATRLTDGNLVQLGYGAKQRRIWTAETDLTSAIAESISRDKDLTKSLLSACGVPVPEGRLVDSAEDAWDAAESIGLPVVVKPCDANHGRGVFIDLKTRAEIERAYGIALEEGSGVIVEKFIEGNEHRLLVVGSKVVAAAKGESAWITGDGTSTVQELIDAQLNSDPRRGRSEDFPLNPVRIDTAARLELERQGFTADSVPAKEQAVLIQRNGNVAFDVTDIVHPSVAKAAALAARIVGLDIAGIDLVAQDISRPLKEQGAAIVEVNAGPGLLMHLKPADGQARPVGKAIVEHLFPEGEDGRIPVVGITGTQGTTLLAKLVSHLLRLDGHFVGLACKDGLYFDDRQVQDPPCDNWKAARRTLLSKSIEAAVLENPPESILNEGLAYDRCAIGVVTDLGRQLLPMDSYIDDEDRLYSVVRTQVDVVLPSGSAVLNADDALVADMARLSDGGVVLYSAHAQNAAVESLLAEGGKAVVLHNQEVVLREGTKETRLFDTHTLPLLKGELFEQNIGSVLGAVASAWAAGVSVDLIAAGVYTFGEKQMAGLCKSKRKKAKTVAHV